MQETRTNFARSYLRTIRITFGVVLAAALGLGALQFVRGLDHEMALLKRQFQKGNADLGLIIEACVEHVRGMRLHAEDHFNYPELAYPQPLFQFLHQNDSGNYYHLDSLPYLKADYTGNLTGKGKLADLPEEKLNEIQMALGLNPLFKITSKNIPNATWVYYTSEDFINIYPHVPSKDFRFTEELFYHDFYQLALPSNNPRKEIFWTIAYIDQAGKGLMVTCADPIYNGQKFMGSVSVDLTLDSLNAIIASSQLEYGEIFVVNPSEQLIAHPTLISAADTSVRTLDQVFPKDIYHQANDLATLEPGVLHQVGAYYLYYENIPHTPWKMVYFVKIWEAYWKVFSSIAAALLFFVVSMALVLIIANRSIARQFISPAQQLVEHLQAENLNLPSEEPNVPLVWLEWFDIISQIFQSNRDLVSNLEFKVQERTQELSEKNEALQASQEELRTTNDQLVGANKEISETNKKITDSINYARRIQRGVLPSLERLEKLFYDSFCLYTPRDIVSGDFYWFDQIDNIKMIAVADCTGHGVPGAFMSLLGATILEDIALDRGVTSPEQILEVMRTRIMNVFELKNGHTPKDGLNISFCTIDSTENKLRFAGAYHPLYVLRSAFMAPLCVNGVELEPEEKGVGWNLYQIKGDKQPIGHFVSDPAPFSLKTIDSLPGDTVYMFSDGYVDQFGGPDGRKYMSRRFKRTLLGLQGLNLTEQRKELKTDIRNWMGELEQVDDICVIGFRL